MPEPLRCAGGTARTSFVAAVSCVLTSPRAAHGSTSRRQGAKGYIDVPRLGGDATGRQDAGSGLGYGTATRPSAVRPPTARALAAVAALDRKSTRLTPVT